MLSGPARILKRPGLSLPKKPNYMYQAHIRGLVRLGSFPPLLVATAEKPYG